MLLGQCLLNLSMHGSLIICNSSELRLGCWHFIAETWEGSCVPLSHGRTRNFRTGWCLVKHLLDTLKIHENLPTNFKVVSSGTRMSRRDTFERTVHGNSEHYLMYGKWSKQWYRVSEGAWQWCNFRTWKFFDSPAVEITEVHCFQQFLIHNDVPWLSVSCWCYAGVAGQLKYCPMYYIVTLTELGFALVVLLFLLYYPWIIIVPQAIYSRINSTNKCTWHMPRRCNSWRSDGACVCPSRSGVEGGGR